MIPPDFVRIRDVYDRFFILYASSALGRLTFALTTGKLLAFNFDRQAKEQIFTRERWQGIDESGCLDIFKTGTAPVDAQSVEIVVREDELASITAPTGKVISDDPIIGSPIIPHGRPPKFNWDAIWAGIVLILHEEGLPNSAIPSYFR